MIELCAGSVILVDVLLIITSYNYVFAPYSFSYIVMSLQLWWLSVLFRVVTVLLVPSNLSLRLFIFFGGGVVITISERERKILFEVLAREGGRGGMDMDVHLERGWCAPRERMGPHRGGEGRGID